MCSTVCKYRRTTWGDCDTQTNTRQMVKTLKRGDSAHCGATSTTEKKCKKNKPTSEGMVYCICFKNRRTELICMHSDLQYIFRISGISDVELSSN